MRKTWAIMMGLSILVGGGVAQGQVLVGDEPNPSFGPLHAWYDVNQSLDAWEVHVGNPQWEDEYLVDVRDTATGSGDNRDTSYPTNVETWAQFDESGGTFWPARVGGFTGTQNGMTTWEVRNGSGWDANREWTDADGMGTSGIGYGNGFTAMWAMNILEIASYNSSWDQDPVEAKEDSPMLNGVTSIWNEQASPDPQPGKALLWLDSQRTGHDGPVWVMDNGVEMVAGDVTLSQWQVHTFEYNIDGNGASKHYINGAEVASGDAGLFEMPKIDFWITDGGWWRGGNFDFAEGLFYDAVLDAADRSGLETYLYDKWIASSTVDGDFNDDGDFNCLDIDALVGEIVAGTNDPSFDMTADGLVDGADQTQWLADAATENGLASPYKAGDADLSGDVDVSDFNTWNNNKFTDATGWCSGNFNYDAGVDVSDFNEWNTNKFTSSNGVSAVPEPAGAVAALLGLVALLGFRRRK